MKELVVRSHPVSSYSTDVLYQMTKDIQLEYRLIQIVEIKQLPTTVMVTFLVEKK